MISGMALTSYRVLQFQHLSYIKVGSIHVDMDDPGISLDKTEAWQSPGHLELLVASSL